MAAATPAAPHPMRRAWLLVLAITLFGAVRAALTTEVRWDFLRYHRAGRLVATGRADLLYDQEFLETQQVYAAERSADQARRGEDADRLRELEFKYLPALAVMMAPLGALHPRTAFVLWGAWNGFLISVTFLVCWRYVARGASGRWMWLPCLVLGHVANDNSNLGQLNPSAIAPATLGLAALAYGRVVAGGRVRGRRSADVRAGLLIALGTVVKFMPAVLALWMAWKRRWLALLVMAVGVAALGWGLPAAVLGPGRASDLTAEYYAVRAPAYTGSSPEDLPGHSIKSFVYRIFGETKHVRSAGGPMVVHDVSVVHLPGEVVYWLVIVLNVALLAVILWRARGPQRPPEDPRGALESGTMLIALLLVSPEARGAHFLYLTLPAVALTYALVRTADHKTVRWRVALALAIVGSLLMHTNSTTLLGRDLSLLFVAYCSIGWAAVAFLLAIVLLDKCEATAPR